MEMKDISNNNQNQDNANNNAEEVNQLTKDLEKNSNNPEIRKKLLPFPNYEIKRFKNKYWRRSIHSIICLSFFIVMLLINYIGVELFFSIFKNDAQSESKFEIRPKSGDNNQIIINKKNWEQLSEDIKNYLSQQKTDCDLNPNFFCFIKNDINKSQCSEKNSFGLRFGNPCIFVDLKPITEKLNSNLTGDNSRIHLKCDGIKDVDKEAVGPIDYIPRNGIPIEYVKSEVKSQSSPFIVVHLLRPEPGILFSIKCNVFWESQKEMVVSDQSFQFEILIDP